MNKDWSDGISSSSTYFRHDIDANLSTTEEMVTGALHKAVTVTAGCGRYTITLLRPFLLLHYVSMIAATAFAPCRIMCHRWLARTLDTFSVGDVFELLWYRFQRPGFTR